MGHCDGKKCLANAMRACDIAERGRELDHAQRAIVDVAERIDADFANAIVKIADDDPARPRARLAASERLEVLKLKRRIHDDGGPTSVDTASAASARFGSAAWLLLGALNAKRVTPQKLEDIRPFLRNAGDAAIADTYPMFAYAVESTARKYGGTVNARQRLQPLFEAAILTCHLVDQVSGAPMAAVLPLRHPTSTVILAGERDGGLEFIREWAEVHLGDDVKICDPYFGPADLEIIRLLVTCRRGLRVHVLTARKSHKDESGAQADETSYSRKWREMSDEAMPVIEIVVAGVEPDGELPIHDRWIVTQGGGLKLGGSLNGLGRSKESEIHVLDADEAARFEAQMDELLYRQKRTHNGSRVRYTVLEL